MLELKSLDAGYGSFQALFGINLDVNAGEAVGVIGPNGAGKTTLMRVISGLIRPTRGTIAHGRHRRRWRRRRTASSASASPTCRRTAGCSRASRSRTTSGWAPSCPRRAPSSRERLEFVFELFPRLKERRHQMAGTMSGGEQQMCAIGRALMCDPKLLLLDEPSAGLAPVVVQQVFELVKRIRAERAHRADRRAERAAGAARRRPRLPAGGRHHPRLRHARPRCWRATRSSRRISVCRLKRSAGLQAAHEADLEARAPMRRA